ncbi:MAG: glycosyltransferase [Mycobacteriales bacterium]
MNPCRLLTRAGTTLAVAGAVHSVVNSKLLRQPDEQPRDCEHPVSILVPARNEADRIGTMIASLRAQISLPRVEILVLDDCSTDRTGDVARAAAAGDRRVRVLSGTPPPPGWLGKPHACAQLATAADPHAETLVFVDADVELEPCAVAAMLDTLHRSGFDFISPLPRLVAESRAERLVQPLLPWSILTTVPLRFAEYTTRPSLAVLAGPFCAVRRRAYDAAGGHAAVRGEVVEDIELGHALRRTGAVGGTVDGSHIARIRMYSGWRDLQTGYGKSAWRAFGSPARVAVVMAVLATAYVVPPVAAVGGSGVGAIGYAAGVFGRVVSARRTGGRQFPDALAHPASVAVAIWITCQSVLGHRRGTLHWKDRPVDPPR